MGHRPLSPWKDYTFALILWPEDIMRLWHSPEAGCWARKTLGMTLCTLVLVLSSYTALWPQQRAAGSILPSKYHFGTHQKDQK